MARRNAVATETRLRVSEIFYSLQGESTRVGLPTVFVRLTGCPLRCVWCDTAYAFRAGRLLSLEAIINTVRTHACPIVCVTGGEPLAQAATPALLSALCDHGFNVSLETSGALDISGIDVRVARIVDVKAPGSGESAKNRLENLAVLTPHDELKLVLASASDYAWACNFLRTHPPRCPVLFSPVHGLLSATDLADWILRDHLPVRMQIQLHKQLWGERRGC